MPLNVAMASRRTVSPPIAGEGPRPFKPDSVRSSPPMIDPSSSLEVREACWGVRGSTAGMVDNVCTSWTTAPQ
jgi:hypothetical protein